MLFLINIEDVESFRIHKRFAKNIHVIPDYLVGAIGESAEHKKLKGIGKIREGKVGSCIKKMAAFLHFHLIKRRVKKKSKNKNKHREKAESV